MGLDMLYDFSIPSTEIKYQGKPAISVRGLSFNDISALLNHHREDVEMLFALWTKFSEDTHDENSDTPVSLGAENIVVKYGYQLIQEAPGIIANIIALAADAHDQVQRIADLPITLQIDALREIGKLTAEDFGGLKKMIGGLMALVGQYAPEEVRTQMAKRMAM